MGHTLLYIFTNGFQFSVKSLLSLKREIRHIRDFVNYNMFNRFNIVQFYC